MPVLLMVCSDRPRPIVARRVPFAARVSLLVLATLLLATAARAGDIVGVVKDPTGATIASAQVTIHNIATGETMVASADGRGAFHFPGVAAGVYRVTARFEGFSEEARTVTVTGAADRLAVDFVLKVGGLALDVTVTATRSEREERQVPLRTDTLTRKYIETSTPASAGDALLAAPAVTPVASGPFEVRPRLRGLDSTRLLVLVDGERLNNARTATDRSGTEVGLADLSTIESLEVVSGSGSVLYGTDALAGTINIITNEPRLGDRLKVNYGFDGYGSSNESGRRGTALFGISSQRVALQIAATREEFGDYRAGGSGQESTLSFYSSGQIRQQDTIDANFGFHFGAFPDPFNAPYTRTEATIARSGGSGENLNAAALVALGARQSLRVKYIRRRMESVGFADFEPPIFFQRVWLPFNTFDRVSARYEARDLARWLPNLKVTAYFQDQNRLLRNEFPVQFPVPSPSFFPISVFRLDILADTQQHVRTPGVDIQGTLLAGRKHLVTAGATVYADRSRDSRTNSSQMTMIGSVGLGAFGPQATVFNSPVPLGAPSVTHPVRVPNSTFRDGGLFIQDEWAATSRLAVTAGVRIDNYRATADATAGYDVSSSVDGAAPAFDPATLPTSAGARVAHNALTGDIGTLFRISDAFSAIAHYGRSYRHPNLEELFFAGPATVGAIAPNLAVKPETGHNVDAGLRLRTGRYAASLTYFNNTYDGFISTEIVANTASGPLSRAINLADVRIRGVEAEGQVPVITRLGVLSLDGSVAYTRGDVLAGANPLTGISIAGTPQDNISPLKVRLAARFTERRDRFWVEYGGRIQSRVNRVAVTLLDSPYLIPQDLLSLQGFSVHRLAVGYNVGGASGRLGVTLAVENLADTFYREQFQFAPARGRSVVLGLNFRSK